MPSDPPSPLPRPLLVMSGWRASPLMPRELARNLSKRVGVPADEMLALDYFDCSTIEDAAAKLMRATDERFANDDPERTTEVDVVAVSMGGLVARYAEAFGSGERRLRIARLFTLATPHRGARLAERIALDRAAKDMKPGSAFLKRLNAAPIGYELVCYARLNDFWVGATNTAPPGRDPIWVRPSRLTFSHLLVSRDRRILDDVSARLLGREPVLGPASPPPHD